MEKRQGYYQRPKNWNWLKKKAMKLSKNRDTYNKKVVDRVVAKALIIYIPEDGDPELELSLDSTRQRRKNAPNNTI